MAHEGERGWGFLLGSARSLSSDRSRYPTCITLCLLLLSGELAALHATRFNGSLHKTIRESFCGNEI